MAKASLTRSQTQSLAHELMELHGLLQAGWSFRLDRAKRYSGITAVELKEIRISGPMATTVEASAVRETILHEIAHALVGNCEKDEHGPIWLAKALEIGSTGEAYDLTYIPRCWTSKCPRCKSEGEELALLRWRKLCPSPSCSSLPAEERRVSWIEVPPRAIPIPGRRRSQLAIQELEARLAAV